MKKKFKTSTLFCNLALAVSLSLSLPVYADRGVDLITINSVLNSKTAGAFGEETKIISAIIVAGVLNSVSAGAFSAISAISTIEAEGATNIELSPEWAVNTGIDGGIIVAKTTYGAVGTAGEGSPDDLVVQLLPTLDPTRVRYLQGSNSSDKTAKLMNQGQTLTPVASVRNISALTLPESMVKTGSQGVIALLALVEIDSGSGDDDLGQMKILSYDSMLAFKEALPATTVFDEVNKYYTTAQEVRAPSDEDGSVYTVSYTVQKDGGSYNDLGPGAKSLQKAFYGSD
jgi:hypothetical protein